MFSFFFWYVPFILLDFPVNSDVFFTFVLFFLAVPCVSYFFGFLFLSFCYILCHYQCFCVLFSLFFGYFPSFSCFLVISNVLLFIVVVDIVDGAGAGGVGAPRGSLCFEPVVVVVVVVVVNCCC